MTARSRTREQRANALGRQALALMNSGRFRSALPVWRRASRLGNAGASYHIGLMYEHGFGTRPSRAKALRWYRRSANKGFDSAQLNWGILLVRGERTRRTLPKAIRLFRAAARQGNLNAIYNIGLYYMLGIGVKKNLNVARQWLKTAAARGHHEAKYVLRSLKGGGVASVVLREQPKARWRSR